MKFNLSKYDKFKRVTNTKSSEFKAYRKKSQSKISQIQLIIIFDVVSIFYMISKFSLQSIEMVIFLFICSVLFFWYKKKNQSLFENISKLDYKKIANNLDDINDKQNILKEAELQLSENINSVKATLKVIKWIFGVVIIGTFEDDIKSFFNVNSFQGILGFGVLFLEIVIIALSISAVIGIFTNWIRLIKEKIDLLIEGGIQHGMFVQKYELLKATIYILSQDNKNKGTNSVIKNVKL